MGQNRSFGQVTGATAFGAALTTIILYTVHAIWGIEVDSEVQGAITTLVVLIAGWAVPPKDPADGVILEDLDLDHTDDHPAGDHAGLVD